MRRASTARDYFMQDKTIIDPATLLAAYASGLFPMADARDDVDVYWVEPTERAILPLEGFHLSRTLARTVRRDRFRVTTDTAFARARYTPPRIRARRNVDQRPDRAQLRASLRHRPCP